MTKKVWLSLALIFFASFAILGWVGREIYFVAPPIPEQVVTENGDVLFTGADIRKGQQVWQSIGGHQVGSVWGHGSYLAPDWSADWLHRELVNILDIWALAQTGSTYDALPSELQAMYRQRLQDTVRTNTYNSETGTLTVFETRANAMAKVAAHYDALFGADETLTPLREDYAIKNNLLPDAEKRAALNAFFFWTSWAAATNRPGEDVTYTNNWPAERLIGNKPTASLLMWSLISIFALLAGIGGLTWFYASRKEEEVPNIPKENPLKGLVVTPSMQATFKFFAVVALLFLTQIMLGGITAHFAVEGHDFYGIPLAEWLPYTVTRTWHVQLSVFWIATAWLATGLFIAPAISGHEPKFQKWGVNFLFIAALAIVVGSMLGEWLGVQQKLSLLMNFWFGHQGYEFIELGRFWQIFLFVGLLLWLGLVGRALWPALMRKNEERELLFLLFLSVGAIGLFYGAGLMWGSDTHLSVVEYWRWWVVHLWVEGFFEVFATAVIAFLFVRLGLVGLKTATFAVLFSTVLFLTGGILGTFHHLYFSGTPISAVALGATFSALEVVPLVLIGYEGYENYRLARNNNWIATYRWPILFFVAVAFWNFVGAGLFGFLINPPIALYYMQGLNTTAVHAHSALFGVYGMLGLGLMLFCLRSLGSAKLWNDTLLKWAFWLLNGGVAAMVLLSLLPIGLMQVVTSIEHDMWYARSPAFIHHQLIEFLVWMRVPGDVLFAAGGLLIAIFVLRLYGAQLKTFFIK